MAKCDQGYLCSKCGQPVNNLLESTLYLRYVLGEVQIFELFSHPDTHLQCAPEISCYIEHDKYSRSTACEQHARRLATTNDAEISAQTKRVTAAWVRLREVVGSGLPITEYPLKS